MRIRLRFLFGAGLIVAAIVYLIVAAIQNTSEYYMTVAEVSARHGQLQGQDLRVAGRVKPGSIQWDPASLTLRFSMFQIPDAVSKDEVKPVAASDPPTFGVICVGQPKPDMFAENRDVIVEGKLEHGVIEARQVMTSCPSKYKPKQEK